MLFRKTKYYNLMQYILNLTMIILLKDVKF